MAGVGDCHTYWNWLDKGAMGWMEGICPARDAGVRQVLECAVYKQRSTRRRSEKVWLTIQEEGRSEHGRFVPGRQGSPTLTIEFQDGNRSSRPLDGRLTSRCRVVPPAGRDGGREEECQGLAPWSTGQGRICTDAARYVFLGWANTMNLYIVPVLVQQGLHSLQLTLRESPCRIHAI